MEKTLSTGADHFSKSFPYRIAATKPFFAQPMPRELYFLYRESACPSCAYPSGSLLFKIFLTNFVVECGLIALLRQQDGTPKYF